MRLSELQHHLNAVEQEVNTADIPVELIDTFVDFLKQQVDKYRFIDASVSVSVANQIIAIGICEEKLSYQALGHMAKGDSLVKQGKINEAWDELKLAETLYLQDDNNVGWARTRIGLINVANRKGKVHRDKILKDLKRAHEILIENGLFDKSIVLSNNTAVSYNSTGNHHDALITYQRLVQELEAQDEGVQALYMGMIYENMAVTYGYLGKNQQALDVRKLADEHFSKNNQREALLRSQINSSVILLRLGEYAQAIRLIRAALETEWYPNYDVGERLLAEKALIICYLDVGKYSQALTLAEKTQQSFESWGNQLSRMEVLIHQAVAQAELHYFDTAVAILDEAQEISVNLEANYWISEIHRLRSKIFVKQHKDELALVESQAAIRYLQPNKNRFETCSLFLVQARCYARLGQYVEARYAIAELLAIAEQERILSLQADAYLLAGQIHEHLGEIDDAIKQYEIAASIVDYALQTLTLTLRTDFLARNGQAHHQLAKHYLEQNKVESAFNTIEKLKAQVHLTYLIQHGQLRWQQTPQNKVHREELESLRKSYHEQDTAPSDKRDPHVLAEIAKQIESLREQLYLSTESIGHTRSKALTLAETQAALGESELIVVYYETETLFYALLITKTISDCVPLGSTEQCQNLISQCYLNFNAILRSNLRGINMNAYVKIVQSILERLYQLLIKPFQNFLIDMTKLWIVPYGSLHQVPFGCLRHNGAYLIQSMDIALLPYAGQISLHNRHEPHDGVTVVAHSFNQQIPARVHEGQMVANQFGTVCYEEDQANRHLIYEVKGTLLHIAAHAQFRLDHPDLSHIQLADGKLYVDELFQQEIPVELVVLSACETGQAKVAPGDELLGLGRGFLYSGVNALVVSLWRVADTYTYRLMTYFYEELLQGVTKSKALQLAQCRLLADEPDLHPVLWGAFQFIGDSRPLKSGRKNTPFSV